MARFKGRNRLQSGDIRSAITPPADQDRLDRAIKRAAEADLAAREAAKKDRPQPGEIVEATVDLEQQKHNAEKIQAFLRLARERFKLAMEAEQHTRQLALDDLEFRAGQQWPKDIQTQRSLDGRPCLTMNRLPQFIRQITNEQRQQRPSIQINPVGDGADVESAEIRQGIVRHIEVNSDADVAYDTAFEHMVTGGFGWMRLITEYVDNKSFDQEIKIKPIKNPFIVYSDPSAMEPDRCDMAWAFVVEDVPIGQYREDYKESQAASLTEFTGIGDQAPYWKTKETIRVADYYHVEETQRTICQLENGTICEESEVPQGSAVVARRNVVDRRVIITKMNAIEILNEGEPGYSEEDLGQLWPGMWIPLVPVLGDELEVNGVRHYVGIVRNAKDPQRAYNYWISAATELIALVPKAPYVGAEGQFENHEAEWATANVRNFATLQYKPVSIAGTPVPPPQRQAIEAPVQSLMMMTRQADNDLKATTGIYDASLGEKGPDQSGKAILARQKQTDISILNFSDNLARAIRAVGRQLLDLIPRIYDAPRIQRIIAPDQDISHVVTYNGPSQAPSAQALVTKEIQKLYDLSSGRYDVTVTVGPSYQSKRQEAVASQMVLIQAYPQAMAAAGDLLVRNMDWPGAQQIADRLKKLLPPQLQDDGGADPETQLQVKNAQLQQLGQQHELLVKALNDATELIKTKKLELESRERIASMQAWATLTAADLKAKSEGAQAVLESQLAAISQRLQLLHEGMSLDQETAAAASAGGNGGGATQ